MTVDVVDFAVIDDDAHKQFNELLGNGWIEVGQFVCQFIAYSLGFVIGHLPTCILFLIFQLCEPLPQFSRGRLLGMLYLRGDGVKENKVAGVALLLLSASRDPSPENHAKQNLSRVRGLTAETAAAAQKLFTDLSSARNLLLPLDKYLDLR